MIKIAINGFGRVGRVTFRAALARYFKDVEVVAINTSGSMDTQGWAHLLKYDSVYGKFEKEIEVIEAGGAAEIGRIKVGNEEYPVLAERNPAEIPWSDYGPEVVIESTGVFRDKKSAGFHLRAGAKKVIVSAPPKSPAIPTYLMGVNEKDYKGEYIISNGSCTTNCIAPIVKIFEESYGIEEAFMTTIHAYTAGQELVDGSHQDWRRARAAGVNIVPTTTGAAEAVIALFPKLKGKFAGAAIRVPVVCGSFTDFTFRLSKDIEMTIDQINQLFADAAAEAMKNILRVAYEPIVSTDILGDSASAIVDSAYTEVIRGDLIKVGAWYDNEWGYGCRLIELASHITKN